MVGGFANEGWFCLFRSKKRNTDEEGDEGGRNVSFMEKPEVRVIPPVEEEEEGTTTKKTGRKKRKTGCI